MVEILNESALSEHTTTSDWSEVLDVATCKIEHLYTILATRAINIACRKAILGQPEES
jgi:hypothetical protein